jgi:hypothetical protein
MLGERNMFKYSTYTTAAALLTGSLLIPTAVHALELEERVLPIISAFGENNSNGLPPAVSSIVEELDMMELSRSYAVIPRFGKSGALYPWQTKYYGPHWVIAGQTASAFLNWNPASCDMEVGLWNGTHYGLPCTGGFCFVSGAVPAGIYHLYVKNLCAAEITDFSVFYWFE